MISEFIVVREGQVIVSAVSLFAFGEGLFPFLCLPERFAHLGHKPLGVCLRADAEDVGSFLTGALRQVDGGLLIVPFGKQEFDDRFHRFLWLQTFAVPEDRVTARTGISEHRAEGVSRKRAQSRLNATRFVLVHNHGIGTVLCRLADALVWRQVADFFQARVFGVAPIDERVRATRQNGITSRRKEVHEGA